ncbi:MAG: sn-glycerol-3-phosphate ABC transporter ATP-binding protein UgpC [Armatimonadota bacterium]|nr:sn-glycerol-3-phosphate ABC transporter ATP-binding protein UgpC [Armatimonadota bacterium]MDR7451112.1 sn-glycerol-3-phosphate ABC transporter ATP-binding protein UgpC [Armatimonadota bacterium]MDR7467283.1 sn-glycerol-3-phosphate ABC transporter ATP-binding protein UgpC [Armatimonadota bacterium]MDR7494544.1 sn-glycerol-3-phosphate ABC transporter ATP-binding protein UgpC [Armatimonadota bacterium]MDR7499879.1 sn-glycerol-3-phosphate ABC transporter ATP-binding protein UgpC [Armatimonadota
MAKVQLEGVTKKFGAVTAVNNVSLEIPDKQFTVLVGPSGCGKTTALRLIAGLEEATAGDIYIGDRRVNDVPPKDRDIAMVFQNYALYPHMSVYDNMAFGLRLRKYPKAEIDRRVKEAAEMLGIEGLLDRKPKQLSGGQRQRVALGRAIVREPQVFLMDEPLSNLDAKLRVQTRAEIKKLHARLQTTTVYVTHDQVEAMTMGDRIVVMRDGIVQQVDTPLNLYEKPANLFVAGFIGSPAMNFVEAKIVEADGALRVRADGFQVEVPRDLTGEVRPWVGKPVIFGIRPEDIQDRALAASPNPAWTIRATVDVHEPLGSDVILYLTAGAHSIVARVDAHTQAKMGQEIEVVLDMRKMHLFDPQTQQAIL